MRACRLLDILPDGGLTYDGGQRRVIPASGSRGLFFIRRNASRKHAFYNLILTQPSSDRQRPAEDHPDDGWVRGQPRWLHGAMHAQNTVKLINKYCAGFCCVTCMYVCVCVCASATPHIPQVAAAATDGSNSHQCNDTRLLLLLCN